MDAAGLSIAAAIPMLVLLVAVLVILLRREGSAAREAERGQLVRDQLVETGRQVGELGRLLAAMQAETRAESDKSRAQVAEAQATQGARLQQQVTGVMELVAGELGAVRRAVDERLQGLSGSMSEQLTGTAKVIGEVKGQLGALAETAKNIQELSKDIGSLQDILRAPKLRGNLGELFLEEILRQVLPADAYAMQHRLPGGERGQHVTVDAVVKLGDRYVAIDAKFPLESFQRLLIAENDEDRLRHRRGFIEAVKRQVDEIATKYIRPDAGTYDFALMYLPAENVYYEAVIRDASPVEGSVVAHAAKRKVILVSPNTLYAYLLTIAYGLKGMQIEHHAEAIRGELSSFQQKFVRFYEEFERLGKNLGLAQKHFDDAARRAVKLHDQVGKITGSAVELEGVGTPALPERGADEGDLWQRPKE
ncbi:MAG: DNA recombination protein RmuC [Deltaproteobacteria bacterium]|nr:DNA recombination protein RmuC [Deltaproteobacteria bacterium]